MSPREKPSFYLYSRGYSPDQITLGTLVFRDYANPDHHLSKLLPKVDEDDLAKEGLITCDELTNTFWEASKNSTYGLGVNVMELADISSNYAATAHKIIFAQKGRRVVIDKPAKFFTEKVFSNHGIKEDLTIWLSAARASHIFRKATFQKPKVYCVTGFYELRGAVVRVKSSSDFNANVGMSPEAMAAATGVPIGAQIGPFWKKKHILASSEDEGPKIWAARFHQLDVEYISHAAGTEAKFPTVIKLRPDVTDPGGGLMGGNDVEKEAEKELDAKAQTERDARRATDVRLGIYAFVAEMENGNSDGNYALAFEEAEHLIREDAEADGDDDDE